MSQDHKDQDSIGLSLSKVDPTSKDATSGQQSAWLHAKEVFLQAIAQPASDRQQFVQQKCGDSPVAAHVAELLKWHESEQDFLNPLTRTGAEQDSIDVLADFKNRKDPEHLEGQRIGGFVLGAVLGQGSMGTVYEARQIDPDRPAALKILRADNVFAGIEKRLHLEASILARLDHPGIARIYSAGTVDLGTTARPWFAMELIHGPTLLEFVRQSRLDRRRILELITQLCDAVEHAHRRNVIHRDLKPENILVRVSESSGQSKEHCQPVVLDFGVARISTPLGLVTQATATGQIIGTLTYMSPEQFSGRPELVDARSDVYALGVIGYQLLSGKAPHDRQGSSIIEVVQRLASERPKQLVELDKTLKGDLNTLFYKAVEPDVDRRYQSVSEFSSDIRAFLNHQPIRARPATFGYRARKFVRRNHIVITGLATTFLAMAVGMIAYSREASLAQQAESNARQAAQAAQNEADKTKAVNEFLTNDFMMRLLASTKMAHAGSSHTASDLAKQASANLSETYRGKPILEAAVRNELGTIFYNLHSADDAAEQFELVLRLWGDSLGPDHIDTLKAVNNLGQARMLQGRREEAEALYRRALSGRIAVVGENHPATAATMNNLSEAARARGDLDEAESYQKQAVESLLQSLGEHHRDTITIMANYGSTLVQTGRIDQGLAWHSRAYEASRVGLGDNHITTLHSGSRLAQTLLATQEPQLALDHLRFVLNGLENIYGLESIETVVPRRLLARAHKSLGDREAAVLELERALAIARAQGDRGNQLVDRITRELDSIRSEPIRQSRTD